MLVAALERVESQQKAQRLRQEFLQRRAEKMQSETPVSPSDPSPVTSLKSLAPTTAAAAPSPPPPPSTPVEEESLSPKAAPSVESMDSQPLEVDEEWEDPSARKTRKGKTTKAAKNVQCIKGCGKKFTTKVGMRKHLNRVHVPFAFTCRSCDKKFKSEYSLKRHLSTNASCTAEPAPSGPDVPTTSEVTQVSNFSLC
ncbi:hypothetical protein HOLleu_01292 [Holothuria leucospilota]|uniref:C2H2-type domain-containing protein n=1 Tax=Holothuria leucospilota TaxID=206669 RepID=A0A9Q1CP46_HOLLE|nr:hypothetical protein HOLleu_01292 [Holothuria leucospilota]